MRKGDKGMKVFGVILILAIIVSVFGGLVSAGDVSGGLKQSVVDKAPSKDNIISDEEYGVVPVADVSEGLKQSVADAEMQTAGDNLSFVELTKALDADPLHQLPATSGKISYFASDDGHPGMCNPAAWGELLGENCGTDDATKYWYCAMRWPYVNAPTEAELYEAKAWWHDKKILVTYPTNGKQVVLAAKDWGPAEWTGRVIDVSKTALDAFGVVTDDTVNIEFADQGAELGVVSSSSSYDSQAAVNYADGWWNGRNSNNPDLCDPYIDYGDYDCANFVSQCLIAGGLDLSGHPGAYSCECIPYCDNLHDYLVNYLGASWETRSRGQEEPPWFVSGDAAIFGKSYDIYAHAVFAVTGDVIHSATCNAHSPNAHHVSIENFYNAYPSFDRCTYYHIANTAESIITPLSGDLNDDGTDSYGTFDSGTAGFTFNGKTVHFGTPTDLPVMGDWDNDGNDEIGIYRPDNGAGQSEFHLVWQDWGFFSDGASVDAAYRKVIPF